MTDADYESLARKWCEQMGKRPYKERGAGCGWYLGSWKESYACLPIWFVNFFGVQFSGWQWEKKESTAFIALGKALDQVFREVPDVGLIEAARIARHALESCANGAATKSELLNSAMDIKLATARYEGIK